MESKVTPNLFSNALSQEKTTINIKLWRVRVVFSAVAQFWDCFLRKIVFGVFPAISLTIKLCLGAQNLKVVNMNIYKLIRRRPKPTLLTSPSWFTTLANNIIYEIRAQCLPHQSEKKLRGPFFNRSMWLEGALKENRFFAKSISHGAISFDMLSMLLPSVNSYSASPISAIASKQISYFYQ